MNRSTVWYIVLVLAVVAGIAGAAYLAFNAGSAYGLAQSGKLPELTNQADLPPRLMAYHHNGFFGFPGLGCLSMLAIFFMIMVVLRTLCGWQRPHHWHGHFGPCGDGAPPFFEEWHRREHETKPSKE